MSWDILPKANMEYALSKLKTDVLDYKVDTEAGKGLSSNDYTTADKNKLAGIAAGAEVNQNAFSNVKVGSTTIASGEKTATLELEAGSNITLTPDTANKKVVLAATDTTYSDATTSVHGLMSAADKIKLDGISTGANKVESSETNGNIKIDTVETQVYDDSEIQEVIDISLTETDYANPLTLETMQAQLAKNTKIKIDPIQDLHGYDKPWVGGAGKNKFNPEVTGDANVTFTINNDGSVSSITTGEVSARLFKGESVLLKANTPYTLSCSGGNSANTVSIRNENGSEVSLTAYEGKTDTLLNEVERTLWIYYRVQSASSQTITLRPQLEESSTPTSFEPYKNICPISGYDEIDLNGCGKNLSSVKTGTNKVLCRAYAGKSYTIAWDNSGSGGGYNIFGKDDNGNREEVFTVSKRGEWATAECSKDTNLVLNNYSGLIPDNIRVYNGIMENKPDYIPYQSSNDLSIDLPLTVYGGVLDLESGVLSVETESIVKDGSNDETVVVIGTDNPNIKRILVEIPSTSMTWNDANAISGKIWSNEFTEITNQQGFVDLLSGIHYRANGSHEVIISPSNPIITDEASARTWLSNNPVQIIFTYATPTTIQLTPQQLYLLKNQNNLTTSQYTQIKVTYRNGVFATLEELSDTAQDIYDEISGDTTTVSGNPINFTTREKQKSKSTIIDLEPIQDLHGFTKPWVGGAGKNLLLMTLNDIKSANPSGTWSGNVYTINGITFTILMDGDSNVTGINVNGTAMYAIYFLVSAGTFTSLLNKSLTLNGCPANGSNNTYQLMYYIYDGSANAQDFGNGVTFIPTVNSVVQIVIRQNVTINNLLFNPMLRLSTVTDATFEPYTNIASISGRSSVDIDGCGKNLIGLPGGWDNYGVLQPTASAIRSELIAAKQGDTYIASKSQAFTTAWEKVYVLLFDVNNNFISQVILLDYGATQGVTYTVPSNVSYIAFSLYLNVTDLQNIDLYHVQVEKGSVCSLFEPYTHSTDLTISFGTTVYGGRLDVEKGELVVDRTDEINLGDYTWTMYSSGSAAYFDATHNLSNIKNYGYGVCDCYELSQASTVDGMKNGQIRFNSNKFYIKDLTKASATELQNSLSGKYATCELETPQTIQLTPQQVQLLKGINNISTTGTTITVTFKNGSVAHLDDLPDFTDYDKEKLASIDTLAVTLDLLTHTLVVTQDI